MNKIQKKRLLNVAKALRESKTPKAFNMGFYGYHSDMSHPCGTPACAFGHYASRTDLQKTFKLDFDGEVVGGNGYCVSAFEHGVGVHFGLGFLELEELFDSDGCGSAKTVKQAARYIERFVARKEKAQRKSRR